MRYFISGHRDLTELEFKKYYKLLIDKILIEDPCPIWLVGDFEGCDTLAVEYLLSDPLYTGDIEIYTALHNPHMKPFGDLVMNFEGVFVFVKRSYDDCDESMTNNSDFDIAWIRPGREDSHTAKNIKRRYGLS